ncbi:putative ORFan [Tupanvirus deep ocean]|uniref:ORFan n=2 Tax=Tupanvirus TaxID=2094720 RepID=A0AC62A9N1_9VIRU|nr:putative ORFan [Tupanvirus deep ocean]QKU34414.1 putative ORFan [Tupanvirus deep ocean]
MQNVSNKIIHTFEIKDCIIVTYRRAKRVVGAAFIRGIIVNSNYPEHVNGCEYFINMDQCLFTYKKDSYWFLRTNFGLWKILDTINIAPKLEKYLKNHETPHKPVVELTDCVLHYKPMSYFLTGKIITETHPKFPTGKKIKINMATALAATKLYGYWTIETPNTIWRIMKTGSSKSTCYDIRLDLEKNLEKSVDSKSYSVFY